MAEHSKLLSPSASHLWIPCSAMPQAVIDADIKEQAQPDADRGTKLHEYSRQMFIGKLDRLGAIPQDVEKDDWNEVIVAVDAAKELLKDISPKAIISTEMKVSQGGWRKDCFGTADIVVYDEGMLYVLDYKFGRVRVGVIDNPQLNIYALACIEQHYPKTTRVLTGIIQPKISHAAICFTQNIADILKWDKEKLAPAQAAVISGKTTFVPGPHCAAHYCKLGKAGLCKALNGDVDDMINEYFLDEKTPKEVPQRSNIERFLRLMRYEKVIEKQLKMAWAVATELAKDGEEVHGFKLVKGKGSRAWKDEKDADKFMTRKGIRKEDRYKSTLITAPQCETLLRNSEKLKTDKAKEDFQEQVEWREGATILVPDDDPREAVSFVSTDDAINDLFDLDPVIPSDDDDLDSFMEDLSGPALDADDDTSFLDDIMDDLSEDVPF